MKKFEFSLSHMRDYKERILDEELGVLQRLKNERDLIREKIDLLNREFRDISREMQRTQQKGTTIMKVRGYSMQLSNIRAQLKDLELELQKAGRKVDQQTRIVIEANQEVSKLDKLQEKQYEAYRHEAQKAEELRVEELIMQELSRREVG